jgi:hypothetical protein
LTARAVATFLARLAAEGFRQLMQFGDERGVIGLALRGGQPIQIGGGAV